MKTRTELLQIYAEAWNNLDAEILSPYLTDDFEYGSMYVFASINGKEDFLKYLRGKYATIKRTGSKVIAKVAGPFPSAEVYEETLWILQDGVHGAHFDIKVKDGKLKSSYLLNYFSESQYKELFKEELGERK